MCDECRKLVENLNPKMLEIFHKHEAEYRALAEKLGEEFKGVIQTFVVPHDDIDESSEEYAQSLKEIEDFKKLMYPALAMSAALGWYNAVGTDAEAISKLMPMMFNALHTEAYNGNAYRNIVMGVKH